MVTAVSVLMPTFEREDLIGDALRSALDQTFEDFVILVGDNSESDATEELIKQMDDPRIVYHRHRPGIGPQNNWLDLVRRAETPLVATLHDDDLWAPNYLETVVPKMLADPSIGMTFTDFWMIDQDGNRLEDYSVTESVRTHRSEIPSGRLDYDPTEGLRLVAVWNAPQPAYAAVVRRDEILAVDFNDEISPLYDIWLSYNLVKSGVGLSYEPARLTSYRVHLGAATSGGFSAAEDRVFARILDECVDAGPIVDEIRNYWSTIRWARATRMMSSDSGSREDSQVEFAAAVEGLSSPRKQLAQLASRSAIVWELLRSCRSLLRLFRARPGDSRYGNGAGAPRLDTKV